MRIAIIGIRGIPVIYSGFETFAEELSVRMAGRGHQVTVYCRKPYVSKMLKNYKEVSLVTLPSLGSKNLETILHSLISTVHSVIFAKYDLVYFLGVGSAIYCWLPRVFGTKTMINVDGLDWKREKWGIFARGFLSISERFAMWFSNQVVTDSEFIQRYYMKKFKYSAPYIPYGYLELENNGIRNQILKKFGLKKGEYYVWVGRLVPDNHLDVLIKAFQKLKTSKKFVVIGDNINDDSYKKLIRRMAGGDKRIVFVGFQNRKNYQELVSKAFCYVETKQSGGTHPSLVEAMGFGSLIVANNHPANRKVLGKSGIYFKTKGVDGNDLTRVLEKVEKLGSDEVKRVKIQIKSYAIGKYSWESIVDKYEKLFGAYGRGSSSRMSATTKPL